MDISHRLVNHCAIIDVEAGTVQHPQTVVLKNYVNHLLRAGITHFVFNLQKVSLLDSFGVAVLLSIYKQCRQQGGMLSLCELNPNIMHVMTITRMDRVLTICENETDAIALVSQGVA